MNKINVNRLNRRMALAAMAVAASQVTLAQTSNYPSHPIRIFVGYAAGGGVDTNARIIAQQLGAELNQPVIIENRAGATGMLAAEAVARSTADGYTLFVADSSLLITPQLQAKAPLDPLKAFAPVSGLFQSRLMIVANNSFPASNPRELIATLKANPGRYSYATSGIGTVHHLGMELFKAKTGVAIVHIPYRGASQIIPDVINGEPQLGVVSATAAVPQARAGRLKAIASMSTKMPGAPEIATMDEVIPGYSVAPKQFLLAPAGTPAAVIDRLSGALRKVLTDDEFVKQSERNGVTPDYLTPDQLHATMVREATEWARVIKDQGIKGKS
jgi:tripartite-type tricarboxylate transporter receptor subunit TctC